jgi:hypothetical protein
MSKDCQLCCITYASFRCGRRLRASFLGLQQQRMEGGVQGRLKSESLGA